MTTTNTNREHCKLIAAALAAIYDGTLLTCPECGELVYPDKDGMQPRETCPDCGADLEPVSLLDYLKDAYDIAYTVDARKDYRSVRIMVACGGPNIYIDTASRAVELYWWTESASYPLSIDVCDMIDEEFEELYNC